MKTESHLANSRVSWLLRTATSLKYTILHPQWSANRLHRQSCLAFNDIHSALVLDIGSGDAAYRLPGTSQHVRMDYPETGKHYQNRPDMYADARILPLKTASVDVVLLLEVLEHIPDTEQVMSEIQRVLKPEGVLYISVPFIYPAHDLPYDYFRFTVEGLQQLLRKHKFKVEVIQRHGNSVVTLLQLGNLVFLEPVRWFLERNRLLAIGCLFLLYPFCLLSNVLSVPFGWFDWNSRLYLGCFIKAVKE